MACNLYGERQRPIDHLKLDDLPIDVLFYIFKLCDCESLKNLSMSCRRFNDVIWEDFLWRKQSSRCLITNQLCSEILKRSFYKLKAKEMCRISLNWKQGGYKKKSYHLSKKLDHCRFMPWLHLEDSRLWISQGKTILTVERLPKDGLKMQAPFHTIPSVHTEDISRFVKKDDMLFTGGKDKYICGWSTGLKKWLLRQHSSHSQDVMGLDCVRSILVSGSKDGTFKVWHLGEDSCSLHCVQTVNVHDRIWCVSIDPSLSSVAAGSAGYHGIHPLHLYDLDRGVERLLTRNVHKNGAAVFDIHWECPNTLITCGFDTVVRLWDLRVGGCVSEWEDPFNAAGYCLATDHCNAVFCGTAQYGRVQLWDKRSSTSVQAYFGPVGTRSPVYSVSFDATQLFTAQDTCINVFDFSFYSSSEPNDYSFFWNERHQV